MPTTPAADSTQKTLLSNLTTLAQTDALTTGNQISMLNLQIASYQEGVALFETRYDYWDRFVSDYMGERYYLDGNHQSEPLSDSDFTDFAAQTGRLYGADADVPSRYAPKRIPEFDGEGLTYDVSQDEAVALAKESVGRNYLTGGFNTPGLSNGVTTAGTLGTGATSLVVSSASAASIPVGDPVLVTGSGTAAIVWVDDVVLTQTGGSVTDPDTHLTVTTPYLYTLTIDLHGQTFSNIATGATVGSVFPGFTDHERTTKVANDSTYQSVLDGLLALYLSYVMGWKVLLANQRTAITGAVNEDQPDATYITNQLAAYNQLTSYLAAEIDVADSGLAAIAALNTTRAAARTARLTYITARLSSPLPDISPYDQRYNYANRLYNLTDGAHTTVSILTKQRDSLTTQQATSNARAASYASESF